MIQSSYYIRNTAFNLVSSAKYLGVIIDSKLNFDEHIDYICKKANTTRAFVHRNTKTADEGQGSRV